MAHVPFEAWRKSAEETIDFKIRKHVLVGSIRRSEAGDVRQELLMRVHQHIDKFDPSKAKMATFISRIVDSHLAMYLRDRSRQKRAQDYRAESIDAESGGEQPRSATLGLADHARRMGVAPRTDAEHAADSTFIRDALATLPGKLFYLVPLLGDLKPAAIARKVRRPRSQVNKDIMLLREHFRRAAEGDRP